MNFFYCYDRRLLTFLLNKKFKYICAGLHMKTSLPFWQFQITDELQKAIQEYNDKMKKTEQSTTKNFDKMTFKKTL